MEENKGGEGTVAVTTQESLDGIRGKAMRIACLDGMEASSSAREGLSPTAAEIDKTKKAREVVRALVGSITEEGGIVAACDSKSKLWKDVDVKGAMPNWNMKCVDIARSPESALRVFTGSERLANQMKISGIGEVGKLVKRIEIGGPKVGKLVEKNEMGDSSWKMGSEDRDGWSTSKKHNEQGRDGWYDSWRNGEEDPDEWIESWKSREIGKM